MPPRQWVKLWCRHTLEGSLRRDTYSDFEIEQLLDGDDRQNVLRIMIRGLWYDILCLAGDGKYGDIGEIKLSDSVGFTDEQIADVLNVPLSVWEWAKAELSQGDEARIHINGKNTIKVINWGKYQSDYQRQKPYREKAKQEAEAQELELVQPGWLSILKRTFPKFSPNPNWIDMIMRAWQDIDLDAMTQEFVSFWGEKDIEKVEATYVSSLQYARDNKKFKVKGRKDYMKQGQYTDIIQR